MDPPSLPPHPSTVPASIHTATTTTNHQNYPDSTNSSPRSQHTDTWDEPLPAVPGAKLRLMCSYGGHIIPRPHDRSLCYVGGDTRIVVLDRHTPLADFHSRLSQTLLNGRQFTLKYQLPNEDLDSLVSITTDEDLENMIEEYDRINSASPLKPSRLRLFLFAVKPETAASMGCLLDDAKSETWFVDALNDAGLLHRGHSDSAAVDNLVELDKPRVNVDSGTFTEAQNLNSNPGGNKQAINNAIQDVQSTLSDSPMVETASSFESSVSSPYMSSLPPIKVRIDETNARLGGLGEQFSQMNVASNAQKQDDQSIHMETSQLPLPTIIVGGVGVHSGAVTGENASRIISDDEKSDLGAPSGPRKPPLPLQSVPRRFGDAYNLPSPDSKHAGGYNLPSPDSVASDSSIASAASLSKHTIYQDPAATREDRIPSSGVDQQSNIMDPSPQFQMQQVQETMFPPLSQQNQLQQQFVQASAHYIQHAATGQVPTSSYYPVYAPQPQQAIHQQIDQQYPMYLLPVSQTQPYNLPVQSNIVDATSVAAGRPPTPTPNFVPSAAYKDIAPQIYPPKTTTTKPEVPANLYRTVGTAAPTLVQVPAAQFQQQYYGLSQMPPPSQSIPAVSASATNYGYEYAYPTHDQAYYAHHPTATLPQYQTISPAAAVMLSQTPTQLATDNSSQQISSSQL